MLDTIGVTAPDMDALTSLQPDGVLNGFLSLLSAQSGGVVRSAGLLIGIILLYALAEGLRQTVHEPALAEAFGTVCTLAACGTILLSVAGCVRDACAAAESASVFMLSFVPVYAGVLLASGHAALAASYQSVVLFAAELMTAACTGVVAPLLSMSLAMSACGSVTGGVRLDSVGGLLNRAAVWILGTLTTLFTALLSLQSIVGAAADSFGGRVAKLSISSLVPVVGSALGDAFNTVRGCLHLLRSTLGAFGVLATALLLLPPLLRCAVWAVCLNVCVTASELFALPPLTALCKAALGVVKTLIGVLAACGLFLIVTTTIVTMAGGHAG